MQHNLCVRWIAQIKTAGQISKKYIVHDGSSYIPVAIWGIHINLINDDYCYEIADVTVSDY